MSKKFIEKNKNFSNNKSKEPSPTVIKNLKLGSSTITNTLNSNSKTDRSKVNHSINNNNS